MEKSSIGLVVLCAYLQLGLINCHNVYLGINENERRILFFGKTGVGKSTTCNTILGRHEFETGTAMDSVTNKIGIGRAERFGRELLVVDTPGLYDTSKTNEEVMIEVAKCYGVTTPGLHAIVFVMEIGRFTEEENKTLQFFLDHFGEHITDYIIVVFTGKDKLEKEGITIDQYVKNAKNIDLKRLMKKINSRFMVFGNDGKNKERESEVKHLLGMIDDVVEMNGGTYYTNEMYMEAERIVQEKLAEGQRIIQEKHDAEIANAVKVVEETYAVELDVMETKIAGMTTELNKVRDLAINDKKQNDEIVNELRISIERIRSESESCITRMQENHTDQLIKMQNKHHKEMMDQQERLRKELQQQVSGGGADIFMKILASAFSLSLYYFGL